MKNKFMNYRIKKFQSIHFFCSYIFKVEKSKDDLVFEPFLVPFSIVLL